MGVVKELSLREYGLKGTKKKLKPFGPIEVGTVQSEPWKALNLVQAHVYNTLKTFYPGEGKHFKAAFSQLKQRSRISQGRTLDNALKKLEELEWIEVIRYAKHGKRRGLRVKANEYHLTFKYDYKRW